MRAPGQGLTPAKPRRIYGDLLVHGFVIEEINRLETPLPLCEGSETLVLILNMRGIGIIAYDHHRITYRSRTGGLYLTGKTATTIQINKGTTAPSILLVRWSRSYLRAILGKSTSNLTWPLRDWLHGKARSTNLTNPASLDAGTLSIYRKLHHPPMDPDAADLWFRSQSTELVALWLFRKRPRDESSLREDTVERAAQYLEKNFSLSWTLPELAREVGCSPFHLSRIFAVEKGMTIKQYLRELRLRHARDLFLVGNATVTNVGVAVGYRSLSHFSMAFTSRWGCTPESLLKAARAD